MGRDIEKGIFAYIVNQAKKENIEQIKAQFFPTQKNKPIENFLSNCNFQKQNDDWIYMIKSELLIPEYLHIEVK